MNNLINWICLISVMVLILQVMVHLGNEAIEDLNKINSINSINSINKRSKSRHRSVGKTKVHNDEMYYAEKIAK